MGHPPHLNIPECTKIYTYTYPRGLIFYEQSRLTLGKLQLYKCPLEAPSLMSFHSPLMPHPPSQQSQPPTPSTLSCLAVIPLSPPPGALPMSSAAIDFQMATTARSITLRASLSVYTSPQNDKRTTHGCQHTFILFIPYFHSRNFPSTLTSHCSASWSIFGMAQDHTWSPTCSALLNPPGSNPGHTNIDICHVSKCRCWR